MKIGIIQSRGLGDIIIALPIAHSYHSQGYQVFWPICTEFMSHMQEYAPWVEWIPVNTQPNGEFFLKEPLKRLQALGVDNILPLYQSLTGEQFHEEIFFNYTSFDEYKYLRAGVPFLRKWQLQDCITRHTDREQRVLNWCLEQANEKGEYVLVHVQGSDHRANFDTAILPKDIPIVEIVPRTGSCLDWIQALDQAWALILVDSVFSNLTDQLQLNNDDSRYFIPRSHIGLTPTLGYHWTFIENTNQPKRNQFQPT